jgi:hypothetical protein
MDDSLAQDSSHPLSAVAAQSSFDVPVAAHRPIHRNKEFNRD